MSAADATPRGAGKRERGNAAVSHAKSRRVARTDRARKAERRAQEAQERLDAALGTERRTE